VRQHRVINRAAIEQAFQPVKRSVTHVNPCQPTGDPLREVGIIPEV
jgi:hypothetical protein